MKKKIIIYFLIIFFGTVSILHSAEVTLQWSPNTETDLAGYKVFFGTAPRDYGEPINVLNVVEYTLTVPDNILYFFAVTAYDTSDNESGYSNEVSCMKDTQPPGTVINLIINCQ